MLDAWTKRSDVLDLLFGLDAIDDCVERNVLLFEIHRLKQYREPKKPKKQRTINYSKEIVKAIDNYRNAVKYKGRVSYLEKRIEMLNEPHKAFFKKFFNEEYGNNMYINIIPFKNLNDIVKVSDRTIARWIEKGFIKPKRSSSRNSVLVYVDLSEIKQHINH